MVYLWKMVIFHGKPLNNQLVSGWRSSSRLHGRNDKRFEITDHFHQQHPHCLETCTAFRLFPTLLPVKPLSDLTYSNIYSTIQPLNLKCSKKQHPGGSLVVSPLQTYHFYSFLLYVELLHQGHQRPPDAPRLFAQNSDLHDLANLHLPWPCPGGLSTGWWGTTYGDRQSMDCFKEMAGNYGCLPLKKWFPFKKLKQIRIQWLALDQHILLTDPGKWHIVELYLQGIKPISTRKRTHYFVLSLEP